jgi:Druantia protein DruA
MEEVATRLKGGGLSPSSSEVATIQELAKSLGGLSRTELSATVCELLGWRRASGRLKTRECLDLLERLAGEEIVVLPGKSGGRPRGRRTGVPCTVQGDPQPPLAACLAEVQPVGLRRVEGGAAHALWRELVGRYHYLGHATAFGASLRYFVEVARPAQTIVGCLQFGSPAWRMAARDRWIGWSEAQRRARLGAVVQHSRFLLLPWVRIPHLASHVLARVARQLPSDWQERFGVRPLLLETLVDARRFKGTCYRAANWIALGETTGRGRQDRDHQRHGSAPKRIFVFPLASNARCCLAASE